MIQTQKSKSNADQETGNVTNGSSTASFYFIFDLGNQWYIFYNKSSVQCQNSNLQMLNDAPPITIIQGQCDQIGRFIELWATF